MQQPLFNLPHPSIHSGFDDGLPQIPSNLATNAQTHPLNLSNHSDQSKHSHHTMTTNSLSRTTNTPNTTTASYITPPHIPIDGHNTNIEMPTTDVTSFTCNDMLDPDHVFTNPHIEQNDALQIYPSQPLIGDTNTIFDEDVRWTNTNFFSPGHEEIIGAWQTMFPLQAQQTPQLSSPSPYKKARPAPLSIPSHPHAQSSQPHTKLTAQFNDIGLRDPPITYHAAASAPSHLQMQNNHNRSGPFLPNLSLEPKTAMNAFHGSHNAVQPHVQAQAPPPAQKYDPLGENVLFPNHSSILPLNIGLHVDPIIPNKPTYGAASLSAYPTRVAMPIVPSAYQSMEQSFWQKRRNNPSMYPIPQSKASYLMPYTPYFAPNSAPVHRMDVVRNPERNIKKTPHPHQMIRPQSASIHGITNNNNKPKPKVKRKRGRPRKYKVDEDGAHLYGPGGMRVLQTPSPKKRKVCKRSADRKNLEFIQYLKGDGTGPEMQIEDLSPQKCKNGVSGPHAKGFQRGGLRFHQNNQQNVIRIVGGRDKAYKRPPTDHKAYSRIRIWKDKLGRQFYDCICNARKPVQDLNKIKSHVLGHDKIVWVCDICGREFFNNHLQLNAHMKTHKKREIKASEQPIIK
eukprot:88939_1